MTNAWICLLIDRLYFIGMIILQKNEQVNKNVAFWHFLWLLIIQVRDTSDALTPDLKLI